MKRNFLLATSAAALLFGLSVNPVDAAKAKATGWLNWRGPHQTGASDETNLPDEIDLKTGKNVLWKYDITGSGAPTIANGKVYTFAVRGEGQDLREYLLCLDAATGERIWEAAFNDYLSDIVYERYAIGSPTVDAETGNVYLQTTCGRFVCYSGDGKPLWEHSLMERFGRLTFPNGRTGSAIIDDDLVITRGITSYWGADGPARDRFYAFNKKNGELVWSSTPGTGPKDSSFATPVLAWKNGKRVFYTGTGCGNLVCVNARTGEPIFRYHFSFGGVNSSVLLHDNDKLIAVHGKENVDTSEVGRMVAISLKAEPKAGEKGPVVLTRNDELWRQPLVMFTSSPTLVGDRIYQVTHTGELECVDANTGKILWHQKLASGQLHASPLYADGKLYVPMGNGDFYILKLKDDGAEILDKETMGATLLGAPTVWNGRIYLHTKKSLYCFAKPGAGASTPKVANLKRDPRRNGKGEITSLQIVPSDLVLNPGDTKRVKVVGLDSRGFVLKKNVEATIDNFIPPTAKVKAEMDAKFNKNALVAKQDAKVSAGAFKAQAAGASGVMRGRVLPGFPFKEDFEGAKLTVDHVGDGVKFAYPPLAWIGARFKWEIRDIDGTKALAKTLDRVLFQRAITFFGDPNSSSYTMQADIMTDGNRRMKSNGGIINQRYFAILDGNWQRLEIISNQDRIKEGVPFKWSPKKWYTLKSRVDVAADGSGVIRAKAWLRDEAEPEAWNIEVKHKNAHVSGSPGIYGFSPQAQYHVYVDNIKMEKN